jgi:hypothetical protein
MDCRLWRVVVVIKKPRGRGGHTRAGLPCQGCGGGGDLVLHNLITKFQTAVRLTCVVFVRMIPSMLPVIVAGCACISFT